ncbi:MAG: hypothetical protein R3B90_10125 [Planctomycetaceae bacterium]
MRLQARGRPAAGGGQLSDEAGFNAEMQDLWYDAPQRLLVMVDTQQAVKLTRRRDDAPGLRLTTPRWRTHAG